MDAPRALVFRPLVKGNEALGTRLEQKPTTRSLKSHDSLDVVGHVTEVGKDWKLDWVFCENELVPIPGSISVSLFLDGTRTFESESFDI